MAKIMEARAVEGRGRKSLPTSSDPGAEIRLGREKEKEKSAKIINGDEQQEKNSRLAFSSFEI